jgi:LytS/YehU family sensor histidine kinase
VVELSREIEYINNIIELYRIRIKTPEDIRFEVRGDLNVMISPALYVPLIENAFKFASYRNKKPYIDVQLSTNNGIVNFEISNFCDSNYKASSPGLSGSGIINLRKRLDLTYPEKHQLIIERGDSLYRVKLTINTNAD